MEGHHHVDGVLSRVEKRMVKKAGKDKLSVAPPNVLEYVWEVAFINLALGSPGKKIPSEEFF